MKIRGKLFVPLFCTVIFLGIIGHFAINHRMSVFMENHLLRHIREKMENVNLIAGEISRQHLEKASLFTRMPVVSQAFDIAFTGNMDNEDDPAVQQARELLRRELKPVLDSFQETNGYRLMLHFHLPNGRSLVRMWQDKQIQVDGEWKDISDDISFRHMVADVIREHKPFTGIEPGRGGFVIRGIAPVLSPDGIYRGSVEVVSNFSPVLRAISKDLHEKIFVYMNAGFLPVTDRMQNPENYPVIAQKYVLVAGDRKTNAEMNLKILEKNSDSPEFDYRELKAFTGMNIRDYRDDTVGKLVFETDLKEELGFSRTFAWYASAVLALAMLITGLLGSFLVYKNILNPVAELIRFSDKISSGNLGTPLAMNRKDEIGLLGSALSNMAVSLAQMFGEVAEGVDTLNDSASDISDAVENQASILAEQSGAVSEITSTMAELLASFTRITEHSDTVAGLADNALDYSKSGAESVSGIRKRMEAITRNNAENREKIVELGRKSREIAKVMDVINNISDQTKLIAFNAALEASSAGEAGKRFGVVAAEIRRLAASVTQSTGEIARRISEIQEAVNQMIISSEQGTRGIEESLTYSVRTSEKLNEIVDGAQSTADAARQISLSTQQQKTASEQVVLALREIEEGGHQTTASIDKLGDISRELTDLSSYLKSQVENFKLDG